MYLQSREPEVSVKTLQNHRYRLSHFVAWCREEEIENLNRLTGRMLHQYRTWRAEQVKRVTLVNELRTVQQFLGFAASIDGVEEGMRERVRIPPLDPEEEARDVRLETERAQEILTHMERYEYASRDHVIMLLLWHSGIRLGTLRSIDVDDYDSDGRCIDIRHRPESETPLKNGDAAERAISVSEHYCKVLDDYIEHNRHNVRDDYGRRPLISSQHGRLSSAPIRQAVYQWTLPCTIGSCPHDQDPETCEWAVRDSRAGCPSSRSPHAIRRGAITHQLRNHVPQNVVEERSNVSGEVLEQHYDQRTEREKMEVRREFLDALDSDTEGTR
ncbi:tyrosine-type recombinase/integrase [Halobaculum magnesiiphilum]